MPSRPVGPTLVHMEELVRIVVRAVGVVVPGVALFGAVALTVGVPSGDFGTYLGAAALSLLVAGAWAGLDARRATTRRGAARWAVVCVAVGLGMGLWSTLTAPGSPPQERVGETVTLSLFYGVPLLAATGLGVVAGTASRRSARVS